MGSGSVAPMPMGFRYFWSDRIRGQGLDMSINDELESQLANKIAEALLPLASEVFSVGDGNLVSFTSMREIILQGIRSFASENANQINVVEYMERTPEGKISITRQGYSE